MIKRVVKMKFHPNKVGDFVHFFKEHRDSILKFEGVESVELYRDSADPQVLFTVSIWQNEQHLNSYRASDFFSQTWRKTKAMFVDKAEAHSLIQLFPEQ